MRGLGIKAKIRRTEGTVGITSKKGVSQSFTIRTDVTVSTSLVGVRAGSEGAIVGDVVFPGGRQVGVIKPGRVRWVL